MGLSEWDAYLAAYQEQKRLEKYQQERLLPKPKTTRVAVAFYGGLWLTVMVTFVWMLLCFAPWKGSIKVMVLSLGILCIAECLGRLVCIKIVECYQHYASEATRRKCKCIPSCSEYTILCLKKYELIYALAKIRKRLFVTCKGFDYIVDDP